VASACSAAAMACSAASTAESALHFNGLCQHIFLFSALEAVGGTKALGW
jgi:hypothetical protein